MLFIIDGDMSEERAANVALQWKHFAEAFEIDLEQLDLAYGEPDSEGNFDQFKGKTAWAILAEEEDAEYGNKNRVSRYIKQQ